MAHKSKPKQSLGKQAGDLDKEAKKNKQLHETHPRVAHKDLREDRGIRKEKLGPRR